MPGPTNQIDIFRLLLGRILRTLICTQNIHS